MTTTYAALLLTNPAGDKFMVSDIIEGQLQLMQLPGYEVTKKWIITQMAETNVKDLVDFSLKVSDIAKTAIPGSSLSVEFFTT